MKINSTLTSVVVVLVCIMMLTPHLAAASANKNTTLDDEGKKPAKARTYSSRNNQAVKIYPDVLKRVMHVVAKDNEGKEIDFFVFDSEGTLVHHVKMQEGDHQKLTGLERGKYVYHVFEGDEETVIGQFEIR